MRKSSLFWVFLVVVLSIFSFKSLLFPGYFPMHDDLQVARLYQMDLCFRDGQIPCRWVPDMGYGYGYPLFNYYPPLPYYIGELIHLFGLSYIDTVKTLFILGLIFSGIFAFLLGNQLWGRFGGLVTAIFYVYAPYHAVDVFVRGALNEFWGLVLLPAVLWAIIKTIKDSNNWVVILAVFTSFLLLSHNIIALFALPAFLFFSLFFIWFYKKNWKVLFQLILGAIWGLGLASFFTLPVIFEQKFVHIESMFVGYFNYLAHFADLNQLFLSREWGFGPSVWGTEDGMPFPVGQMHWILSVVLFFIYLYFLIRRTKNKIPYLILSLFPFFLLYTYLTHLRSVWLWEKIPYLASMQFPWRMIGFSVFFASIIAGSTLSLTKKSNLEKIIATLLVAGVIVLNYSYFKPEKILSISDSDKLFSAKGWNKLQTDAIFDYLPKSAKAPPGEKAPDYPEIIEGNGNLVNFKKGTDWQKGEINISSEKAKVRLPLYYFPEFRVKVDGIKSDIDYENPLGLITFSVTKGEHNFESRLFDTPVRKAGNIISLISIFIMVFWSIRNKYSFLK